MVRDFFVDIHAHPTLRAYNTSVSEGQRNIWDKTHNVTVETPLGRWARLKTREIAKSSQANLYNYAAGNVRIVFDALYPFEKGFLNMRKLPTAMIGQQNTDVLLQTVTGFDPHQLMALRKSRNYFQELLGQYAFLSKGQGSSPDGQYSYQLAGNWAEAKAITASDPNKIAVIVTIEGAHALNCGLPKMKGKPETSEKEVLQNIGTLKAWKAAPLFINLAHHFYNDLCGHSRSLKPGLYQALNQKKGLNEGISPLGWKVMHELLAVDNGKRILLDIKHMSIKARKEYYKMLESHNRLTRSERVPIVCSHTGLSAFKTMRANGRKRDKMRKQRKSDFHNWAINLSNEEIKIIADSEGMVGLMVDKGILGSHQNVLQIKDMQDQLGQKDALLELVAQNIFQAVDAVGDRRGWDLLALGTDYDGMITHLDPYHEAAQLPSLRDDLVDFLKRKRYGQDLWYGMEPEEMVQKLMQTNALTFLEKYF
jgi:microsomal dipeptidase-like Zn-dependent dipeptidase